jgi:sugar phosphate isomerase/epimerase
VHPAEDFDGIVRQFDTYATAVRRHLDADVLGLGLWLAAPLAAELAADAGLRRRLRRELAAFPYQAFHSPVVKHAVYRPDWTDRRRLDYTLDLARVLVDLLPDGARRGSVSTLPLAWRQPWDGARAAAAMRMLDELAAGLGGIAERAGRPVRVAFEPEPGCVVETTGQAAATLSGVDTDRLGVCLDLAHLACAWEEPAQALAGLRAAGVPVVKVQVSAALEAADPIAAADVLRGYVEPRFLHQTRSAHGDRADDLDEALERKLPGPWRVHYHVPLHAEPAAPLTSTVDVLRAAMRELLAGPEPACDHFDVETYTWGVLPEDQRPRTDAGVAAGIAAELAYARALIGGEVP